MALQGIQLVPKCSAKHGLKVEWHDPVDRLRRVLRGHDKGVTPLYCVAVASLVIDYKTIAKVAA